MMERRYEQRLPLRIDVRVRDGRGNIVRSTTRDVAASGAFIETGPTASLALNDVVRIGLPDPAVAGGWADVAAVVVHHHRDGVGVMFSHPVSTLAHLSRPRRAIGAG